MKFELEGYRRKIKDWPFIIEILPTCTFRTWYTTSDKKIYALNISMNWLFWGFNFGFREDFEEF